MAVLGLETKGRRDARRAHKKRGRSRGNRMEVSSMIKPSLIDAEKARTLAGEIRTPSAGRFAPPPRARWQYPFVHACMPP